MKKMNQKSTTDHGQHSWHNSNSTSNLGADRHRNLNHPVQSVFFAQKNTREPYYKMQTIPRHASEEDFRRNSGIINSSGVGNNEVPFSSEQQQYGKYHGHDFNRFTGVEARLPKQKKLFDKQPKKNNLKETSSTSSAEHFLQHPITTINKQPHIITKLKPNLQKDQESLKRQNFRIIKKLGEGKFGQVFMARELKTGFVLAMKVFEKKKIIADNFLEQFIRELKIQAYLSHPNIIEVYGFFHDEKYFYILLEMGCGGQLYSLIEKKKQLSEEATSFISKSLLESINYIHEKKILHRDIKPENIVLSLGNIKLCDFGWAVNKIRSDQLRSTYCGTPLYLSPEILKGQMYDQKVDLWAVGVLAYELLLGSSPFNIQEQQDLGRIMTEQVYYPEDQAISKEFKEFIDHILNKNPKERLPSSKLLHLKFITKYEDLQTCQQLCQ